MRSPVLLLLAAASAASFAHVASAATITIQVNDPAGQGFNDTTPVTALPTNPGTTRGQQRLNLFNFAAARWAERLDSDVEIVVLADWQGFAPEDCDATGALLGFAGPETAVSDFPGAPIANTWYPSALADALAGSEQDPGFPDINASFNPRLDSDPACLGGAGWYYGTDNQPGSKVDLLNVLMHELGHGLGFTAFVDESTGQPASGQFSIFDRFLFSEANDLFWTQMTNAQRAASAKSAGSLVWNGANVNNGAGALTAGLNTGHVRMYDPNPVEPGSSVSHFDTSATPNLMMEPFISSNLKNGQKIDLTTCLFQDMGWTVNAPFGCPDFLANMQIAVADSADPATSGGALDYVLTASNAGPDRATNVLVGSSGSGAAVTINGVSSSQGGCSALPCNLGTLASGASATVTLSGTAVGTGTATRSATVDADQTDVNAANNDDSEATLISGGSDTVPNPFSFPSVSGVATGTEQISDPVTIAGINGAAPISVSGGTYKINSAPGFTSTAGTVSAGDIVRVRHVSGAGPNGTKTTTLTIGGVKGTFSSTTGTADTTPDGFKFTDQTGVATRELRLSNSRTITGINQPVTVTFSGSGGYRINNTGPFVSTPGTINNGDTVRVQHLSSSSANANVNSAVTIGGLTDVFTTTTGSTDTTPDAIAFADQTGVATNVARTSNARTITGINAPVSITVSGGGGYQLNGTGNFVTTPGTVVAGDVVRLRLVASSAASTAVSMTATVGGISDTFTVTTGTSDTTPAAFSIPDQTGVPKSALRTSNAVTITGINVATPISVAGGAYQINGTGAFVTTAGTIANGDTVKVQHTSSASGNTTVTTTLTVGGISSDFTTTTVP